MSNSTTAAFTTSAVGSTTLPVTSASSSPRQETTSQPAATSSSAAAVSSSNVATTEASSQAVTSAVATSVSVVTLTNSQGSPTTQFLTVTSVFTSNSPNTVSSTDTAAATSTSAAAGNLASTGSGSSSSNASTIAPAVVVPVVVVALLIGAGIWFWRRRQANKEAEELRRKEVEEYGFNPNEGALAGGVPAGMTAASDNMAMSETDGGYRGWGTTQSGHKASTTLGSGSVGAAAIGIARSDSGGNGGYAGNGNHSPNGPNGSGSYSDQNSGDPLVNNGQSRPISQDFEGVAALGGAPAAGSRSNTGVKRGPSNASSAYSAGQRSDTSNEAGGSGGMGSPSWENQYLSEVDGPYGTSSGAAPVIRDVSARRNTRIESPSVLPQQGRGGISQNF